MIHLPLAVVGPLNVTCAEIGNCSAKTPDVGTATTNVVHLLIGLVGMLAVIFVIVSGLQMTLSAGNAKRYQQARMSLLYSLIGVGLALVAYAFVTFVTGALSK